MSEELLWFVAIVIVALVASFVIGERIEECEKQGLEYVYYVGFCVEKKN